MVQPFCLVALLAAPAPLQDAPPPQAPQDAPEETPAAEAPQLGLLLREPGAFDGYTLYAPLRSTTTYLVDMDGKVVHEWPNDRAPGNSVYLRDDGTLLRAARLEDNPVFHGGGIGGRIQLLAPDGAVLWDYVLSEETRMHHHDFAPMPNGNVLLIAWERLSVEDAIALGRDPSSLGPEGLWPDSVVEVKPTPPSGGEIVWEWHVWDHLVQDVDPAKPNYGSVRDEPGRIDINAGHRDDVPLTAEQLAREREREREMRALGYVGGDDEEEDDDDGDAQDAPARRNEADWLHTNAIDYHAGNDWIVLSVPRLDEIWIVDHSTTTEEAAQSSGGRWKRGGDLLYRWGNPRTYGMGGTDDRKLFAQHHAHFVPAGCPGEGHVLLFNNGSERADGSYSSVDEIALPFDPQRGFVRAPDAPFGPAELAWTYRAPDRTSFYSSFISGVQRLPNGNTLVCSGAQGRVFEVTPDGAIVWEYKNPHGGDVQPSFGRAGGAAAPPPLADAAPNAAAPRPGVDPKALFRATRIAADHPGIRALLR